MKTCYMLVGVPGSGKTTWVNQTNYKIGAIVASSDQFIETIAKFRNTTYSEAFPIAIKDAEVYFYSLIKIATENNFDLIIDRTNTNQNKRMGILKQIPNDYRKIAVVFKCDYIELLERLARRKSQTGKSIPVAVIDSMLKNFQDVDKEYEGFDDVIFM